MPKIFLAPYHSNLYNETGIRANAGSDKVLRAYVSAIQEPDSWPYDNGDDPSFFASNYLNGPLSWGVCRGDVREKITEGSAVVFLAFTTSHNITTYRLSGIATVKRKVPQCAIFREADLKRFQRYLNLLVSPCDKPSRKWQWDEPCYPEGQHDNWPWRLADRSLFKSSDFDMHTALTDIEVGQPVNGKPYAFGKNYIIFSTNKRETYILDDPPAVADYSDGDVEMWREDVISQGILSRTLKLARQGRKNDRSLRIPGVRQPHCPAARWQVNEQSLEAWRADFIAFLHRYGFHRRTSRIDSKGTFEYTAVKESRANSSPRKTRFPC